MELESAGSTPVLEAIDARIAIDGVVAIDKLTLATTGDRVILGGDAGALLSAILGVPLSASGALGAGVPGQRRVVLSARASESEEGLSGEAYVVAGTLRIASASVEGGAHRTVIGAAPLDPLLPPQWTAEEYVAWGARLAGAPRRSARDLARGALARLGLLAARARAVGSLAVPERRALVLAQAIVMSPAVLVAEAPLQALEGASAAFVQAALAAALEGRASLVSVSRIDPGTVESVLIGAASYIVVLAGGEIAIAGPPGELFTGARVYSLTVRSNAEPLRAELATRGIELRGGPLRFSTALPSGTTTREILVAAKVVGAAVVELVPVIG